MDCPECEACCAAAICCPPASEEHRVALTNQLIKDGKWTDPVLARKIADATVDHYHSGKAVPLTAHAHEKFQKKIEKIVADHHP